MQLGVMGLLLVSLLATAGAGVGTAQVERDADVSSAERRGSRTFDAVGSWRLDEPVSGTVSYWTTANVMMPVKRMKGVNCRTFDVERTSTETTVTAHCDPPKGRGKLVASLWVNSAVMNETTGESEIVGSCRDRQDMRKDPVFSCTVANPDTGTTP